VVADRPCEPMAHPPTVTEVIAAYVRHLDASYTSAKDPRL
jgi:hypothetical protein